MKTLLKALAVIAALTLTTGAAQAAPSASQIASSWCSDPGRVGRDGLTCMRAAEIRAAEASMGEARDNWLVIRGRLPKTENEVKMWKRDQLSLAYGCAWLVRDSGASIRSAADYYRAASAEFDRIMALRYPSSLSHCSW